MTSIFVAQDLTGQLIYAVYYQQQRPLFCPHCQREVEYVGNGQRRPFFRHITKSETKQAESLVHQAGKQWLATFFQPAFQVKLEVFAPPNQRIDVQALSSNMKLAIEYQCSPISRLELSERQQGYQNKNYHPLWIFGPEHYFKAAKLRHLQTILSYSKFWAFYVLFKLPADNFLRLNYNYQMAPHSSRLYWRQVHFTSWQQLWTFRPSLGTYRLKDINWLRWYRQQQRYPSRQFMYLQNQCYQQRINMLHYVKKTPSQTMFPIYRYFPCYTLLLQTLQRTNFQKLPLIEPKVSLRCANQDFAGRDVD